jgi:hypothetical protein
VELKYIMLTDGTGTKRVPILFFEPLTHSGMYQAAGLGEETRHLRLASAGFVRVAAEKVETYGISESLKSLRLPHAPLPDDAKVIALYNHLHGFLNTLVVSSGGRRQGKTFALRGRLQMRLVLSIAPFVDVLGRTAVAEVLRSIAANLKGEKK